MGFGLRKKLLTYLLVQRKMPIWEELYGSFGKENYDIHSMSGLASESGGCRGEIIRWAKDIAPCPKRTLFAGEGKKSAECIGREIGLSDVFTAGVLDVDYNWNFENNPPQQMGRFDLIISQAILEHLIDPYKHMCDLASLLSPGGYLLVHTVLPGFTYHRYPIDALRFYPDWFEELAKRLNFSICKKNIEDTDIIYMYKMPEVDSIHNDEDA